MEPSSSIPAFLSIDVEPDRFQLDRDDPPSWTGYHEFLTYMTRFRADLLDRTGRIPRFGWYVRTDRQIAEVHGRADHALVAFPRCVERIQAAGDYWGVHAHPLRWDEARRQWVHDFSDGEWQADSTRFALEAFGEWAGTPARRFRAGAAFLTDRIVETAESAGVAVDLSLEPVTGSIVGAATVRSAVDETPMVGLYPDCGRAPREPYRPARRDFRVDGGRQGRHILMIPLTTRSLVPPHPWWWWAARRVVRGPAPRAAEVLYPSASWPSGAVYWDVVERHLRWMHRPYLSLAIRTDATDSAVAARVRHVLDALPSHPLAARLRFEDPLVTFHGAASAAPSRRRSC
jgi:hypothetical protein